MVRPGNCCFLGLFLTLCSFRKLLLRFSAWYNVPSRSPYLPEWFSQWIFYSVSNRLWKTMVLVLPHHQLISSVISSNKYILNWFWNGLTLFYLRRLIFVDINFEEIMFSQALRFFDQFTENVLQETCLTFLSVKINSQKILV